MNICEIKNNLWRFSQSSWLREKKWLWERDVYTLQSVWQLWGGSPPVTAIENSIDSQGVHLEQSFSPSTSDATNCNDTSIDMTKLIQQEKDEADKENDSEELLLIANDITNNRERANEFLKNRQDKKLSIPLGNDEQMLNIAKKDVLLKRKLISQFEKSDKELNASVSKITKLWNPSAMLCNSALE